LLLSSELPVMERFPFFPHQESEIMRKIEEILKQKRRVVITSRGLIGRDGHQLGVVRIHKQEQVRKAIDFLKRVPKGVLVHLDPVPFSKDLENYMGILVASPSGHMLLEAVPAKEYRSLSRGRLKPSISFEKKSGSGFWRTRKNEGRGVMQVEPEKIRKILVEMKEKGHFDVVSSLVDKLGTISLEFRWHGNGVEYFDLFADPEKINQFKNAS